LTGLLVVAISINLTRILSIPQLPGRAAEGLIVMTSTFILSSLTLIPGQPTIAFGAEVLVIGIAAFLWPLLIQLRSWNLVEGVSLVKQIERLFAGAAATLPFVIAGGMLAFGSVEGLYWMAAGMIVSLAVGVWNAWVLLIEILR
jgi:hypothetical protein